MEFRRVLFRSAPHATFASAKIAARRLPMRTWFAVTLLMSTLPVAAQAAEITVDMPEADYSPAMVDAQVGDRILFLNDDVGDHEAFVPTAGPGVDLGQHEIGRTSGRARVCKAGD